MVDEMIECPVCDARFQVITAVSLATLPPEKGGCREGYFCPCCGFEFDRPNGYWFDDDEADRPGGEG